MSETEVMRAVHLAIGSRPDVRLWRQNCGVAYPLSQVRALIDAVMKDNLARARAVAREMRPVRYGLPGMADLMGVLAPSGRLLSVEVKSATGRLSAEQRAWGEMVERFGGLSIAPARSVEEVENALGPLPRANQGKSQ